MIALLPMKAYSERVKNKNIRDLGGKPLFFYIADTLRSTNLFDALVINTDSDKITTLSERRYGDWVEIIERPKGLCGDFVSMNEIINYDVRHCGVDNNYLQTHSTNPFVSPETIVDAVNLYKNAVNKGDCDSLFSVNMLKTRLYSKDLVPINHNLDILQRTQDLDDIYEENSNLYIFSGGSFLKNNNRIGQNPMPYKMSAKSIEVLDIDDMHDWTYAENFLQYGCLL